jgi:hypothetical protein
MNVAIVVYYYSFAGTLAYAAYYGSFLSGAFIVGWLRAGVSSWWSLWPQVPG